MSFSFTQMEKPIDALERALAAERRLECLIRLAAEIIPARYDSSQASYRPPSAWRAFARELSRAKRHLLRTRYPDES
ncbi:MAG: hypothetical protein ACRETT_08135 [Steroidobacteraceae bacterium]